MIFPTIFHCKYFGYRGNTPTVYNSCMNLSRRFQFINKKKRKLLCTSIAAIENIYVSKIESYQQFYECSSSFILSLFLKTEKICICKSIP